MRIGLQERQTAPSFDDLSANYDDLLRDPLRERFTGRHSGFFHTRKRDLIRAYMRRIRREPSSVSYLDVGCGKGELLLRLRADFYEVAGCDLSGKMLESVADGIEVRQQDDALRIPFETERFDFITAVCVYHHVPLAARVQLTREIARVLRPGGIFCIVEHNPWNPVTRCIVSRTPVDSDAILLKASEVRRIIKDAGLSLEHQCYFLYLPAALYHSLGFLESLLGAVPLGGQYAVFGQKPFSRWHDS